MSVYFARIKGYVKIGYSKDVYGRMSSIASGSCLKPADIGQSDHVDLLGWVPGDRKTEKAMHKRFASLSVIGEWFWDDDAYEELITADLFGTPIHELPGRVVILMGQYPHATRAQVIQAYEMDRAEKLADPTSELSQLHSFLGGDVFSADVTQRFEDERNADRAFWREQRFAA